MALYEISSLKPTITYGARGVLEVIQNVRTIVTTRKGTVPLDREFGLTQELLDSPMSLVRAKAEQDIFLQVRKYEPRAEIKAIGWETDILTGEVKPKLSVEIKDAN